MSKDIIIFGAGQIGRNAFLKYAERVDFFIDNNEQLQGKMICGVSVKSVEEGVSNAAGHQIIIASRYQEMMEKQLVELGIHNYSLYLQDSLAGYETDELVINPYLDNDNRDLSEEEWNKVSKNKLVMDAICHELNKLQKEEVLFKHVEIETVNRCNGVCDFCPVSKDKDTREYKVMSDELFQDIVRQLAEVNYAGRLALFSNNEPFLDENILQKHAYARKMLPDARMHLCTNGTLLTLDKFIEVVQYLDELIIDNYQQDLKLIKPCREIVEYCERHPELKKKVTIVLRKSKEILTTRGGTAPNRKDMPIYTGVGCVLPYQQLIIRPDGKVSLCCNDPLGKNTLGDLTKESILDVWYGEKCRQIRKLIGSGRDKWDYCKYCDFFTLG